MASQISAPGPLPVHPKRRPPPADARPGRRPARHCLAGDRCGRDRAAGRGRSGLRLARTRLLAHLDAKFAEKPQIIGLSADGGVPEILASDNGSWTILITYPKRPTCVIATGQAFENIGLPTAGQPA